MNKRIFFAFTIATLMISLAACQSVSEMTDSETSSPLASSNGDLSETTPEPETVETTPEPEATIGDVAQNDTPTTPPASVFADEAPATPPVQSLGASSSGLGR